MLRQNTIIATILLLKYLKLLLKIFKIIITIITTILLLKYCYY